MPQTQTANSHVAVDPVTHLILMPIFLLTLVLTVALVFQADNTHDRLLHLWLVVLALALLLLNVQTRVYALKVQDRVIRLEERLRLGVLLPPAEAALAVERLTTGQLIALRFAPDAELPGLVARTLAEGLAPKAIKAAIVTWWPDLARV